MWWYGGGRGRGDRRGRGGVEIVVEVVVKVVVEVVVEVEVEVEKEVEVEVLEVEGEICSRYGGTESGGEARERRRGECIRGAMEVEKEVEVEIETVVEAQFKVHLDV